MNDTEQDVFATLTMQERIDVITVYLRYRNAVYYGKRYAGYRDALAQHCTNLHLSYPRTLRQLNRTVGTLLETDWRGEGWGT